MPEHRPPHVLADSGEWTMQATNGSALDFHARPLPPLTHGRGEVWVHRSSRPALVLGSAQSDDLVDAELARSAGWEVGRRRSGGGLVVVVPDTHLWVDVVIGPDHRRWDNDVHRAFDWVGVAWARTIARCTGSPPPDVHREALVGREAGRLLCFAGLGAGEIAVDGHKLLGLSQRRTRDGARFQTMLELADHSASLRPFACGPLADLLDRRAGEATGDHPPPLHQGIGLPAGRSDLDSLRDLDRVLGTLWEELTFDPVSPT
ncbi:MAG: hypothetical protein R2710_15635 [Acidimicrobiales bacterium]